MFNKELFKTVWNNRADRILYVGLIAMCTFSFLIGWMGFGYVLYPIEYLPGGPGTMSLAEQAEYVEMAAEWYSYQLDEGTARERLADWNGDVLACRMAAATDEPARRIRYMALATAVNGKGCE